jgi:LmbE family N-acetylglucosaminyl deacetylase
MNLTNELPLRLREQDRLLVFAPHPDDESIACGGLLLAARAAKVPRRVVVMTDGDNNPWPQRWIEKRWRIDAAARARWGARRRAEAQAALGVLGVAKYERAFFGWPDMGLTHRLMHEPEKVTSALLAQIEAFRPTHVAIPGLTDEHPDHSAAHVAMRLALARAKTPMPQCLLYSVHGAKRDAQTQIVQLDAASRELKQRAILQHETQMRLSRKRFLEFAARDETYRAIVQARPDHPLDIAINQNGVIELRLDARRVRRISSLHLLLALETADGTALRWRLPLVADSVVDLRDCIGGGKAGEMYWRRYGDLMRAELKLPVASPPKLLYCKLAKNRASLVVYDRFGWQVPRQNPA